VNGARYYNPTLQRFIGEDPIGFNGGDVNLYAYTGNSATNHRDSSGTSICFSCLLPGVKPFNGRKLLRKIGDYIPVICGAGTFTYAGPRASVGVTSVGLYAISSTDSKEGVNTGTFTDITFGERLQGGYGYAVYSDNSAEHFLFGGVGTDVGVFKVGLSLHGAHVEGESWLRDQIGLNGDAGIGAPLGLGFGSGAGLNSDSLTPCVDHNFH